MATRMQVLAPLGTFVAVAAVAAAVTLLDTGSGKHSPAPLRLATGASQDVAAPGLSTAVGKAGSGDYHLSGTLPTSPPADAAVWDLAAGTASGDRLTRLRDALPTRALQLSTSPGQSWSWSPCGADSAVSSDGTTSSCAVAAPGGAVEVPGATGSGSASGSGSGPTTPTTVTSPAPPTLTKPPVPVEGRVPPSPPPAMAAGKVRTAAAPVFAALGLSVAAATIDTSPYGGTATLDPQVGGLDTVGYTTQVAVDAHGKLQYASGWLGDPTKGDSYPLISG